MLLPWEYGVRNLARRPLRTVLTLAALSTVVLLVFVVVGFIRGLEKSLATSGDDDVVLVYSVNSEENIENSSIAARTPALLTASVEGTWKRFGAPFTTILAPPGLVRPGPVRTTSRMTCDSVVTCKRSGAPLTNV